MKKKLQSFSPGGRTVVAAVVETLSSSRGVHLIVDEDDEDDDDDENTDDEDDKDDDDECNFQVEVEGLLNRDRDNINSNNNKVAGNESAMTTYPLMQALAVGNYRKSDGTIGRDHRKSQKQQQQQQQSVLVPHRGVTCPIPSRPELLRPIALKVIRPIPREAVEQFYQQAYEEGITGDFVHAAVIESHEWHRRWTQQEETGHTMPHDYYDEKNDERALILQPVQQPSSLDKHMSDNNNNNNSTHNQNRVLMMGSLPDHYAFHAVDRATGAKNPSPEEKDQLVYEQRKRTLDVQGGGGRGVDDEHPKHASSDRCCKGSVLSLSPGSDDGDESVPDVRPFFKRRHRIDQGAHHGHDNEKKIPIQQPPPVGIVRPVAIRIARPVAIRPPPPPSESVLRAGDDGDGTDGPVPRDIMRALQQTPSSLSPLTMPSMSSSQRQTQEQRSQVNVVEMDDDDHDACFRRQHVPHVITHPSPEGLVQNSVSMARDGILHALAVSGGDAKSENFDQCLQVLVDHFQSLDVNTSSNENYATEGLWLTLTKPTFFGCAGENDNGDPLYTLGRMSFDMFAPTSIVCSLQGNFNTVERVRDDDRLAIMNTVPKSLREEVEQGKTVLRTYNIVTAFTIEPSLAMYPNAPNRDVHRPIRGIMTTYGYTLADPEKPNRHSVWITGGKIEPNDDDHDQREWKILFGRYPPKHGFGEQAKLLAVKLLMGARIPKHMNVDDGSMEYAFTRPLGGHGLAYVDTLYVDETLRIVRGHRGTIFVFNRLPDKSHASSSSTW